MRATYYQYLLAAVAASFLSGELIATDARAPLVDWSFDSVTIATDAQRQHPATRGREAWVYRETLFGQLSGDSAGTLYGYFDVVEGVLGDALKFDGFTTKVVHPAAASKALGQHFTIEAWVAPQEFSLNQSAIINCEQDHKAGYFFGINNQGHLLIQAFLGGEWRSCTSEVGLPLHTWSHVAATVDAANGLTLFINGQSVGHRPLKGRFAPAEGEETWIGMSQMKQVPVPLRSDDPVLSGWLVFDGLIDEVKMHSQVLSEATLMAAYQGMKPIQAKVLDYRRMPSGPKDSGRFGAFYTRLNYSPEWENMWRVGDHADVVVTFEDSKTNFVFWRGTSYIPHWVTENDIWYNNQFVERRGGSDGCIGCIEPMSDKKCRFSHVRVLQSSPARTVIHWRYAPIGLKHKHPYMDPYSGQGDWVDEYYTLYPNMVGVRSMTLHSTAINDFTDWQEAIIVHPPGTMPEDNLQNTALSIGNIDGEVKHYSWPESASVRKLPELPEESCIQIVNLKAELRPFMIVPPTKNVTIKHFKGNGPQSIFRHWNHWPVAHGKSSTTNAYDASKPSHTSLTMWKDWAHYRLTHNSKTQLMLHGMTDQGAEELTGLAKSWVSPAELTVTSANYQSAGYDPEQMAYVIEPTDIDDSSALSVQFAASTESPLVNPAIVVKDWSAGDRLQVEVAASKGLTSKDIKIGLEDGLQETDLVIWLRLESVEPIEVRISADLD
jgi:hypothetical protein